MSTSCENCPYYWQDYGTLFGSCHFDEYYKDEIAPCEYEDSFEYCDEEDDNVPYEILP